MSPSMFPPLEKTVVIRSTRAARWASLSGIRDSKNGWSRGILEMILEACAHTWSGVECLPTSPSMGERAHVRGGTLASPGGLTSSAFTEIGDRVDASVPLAMMWCSWGSGASVGRWKRRTGPSTGTPRNSGGGTGHYAKAPGHSSTARGASSGGVGSVPDRATETCRAPRRNERAWLKKCTQASPVALSSRAS